ncbi:dihydrodipicolinate synthase family protein [Cryptosporangium phraense]|uniref:Dihydrodipicolinate synthase family protein n=1 Tax=Cryptosporangium phraense TaxID=2593070 RepID=A0A545AH42_9ACTN|nr:dihydrodipicolinate synthase family protein [Cryptosporangium phraense]TQS40634.1 dihydrodipicolinate synthase family protein [Cryptosporangium phraense]
MKLSGVIPPVCTPRGADGALDRASLSRLCHHLVDDGVSGLFVGGSSGETALLDASTRLAALDVAVEAAAGRVPVLYGVIETGTARVLEAARPAAAHGAAAIVATVPFYVAPHPAEILAHFEALAGGELPVVAYDIPSATHVRLEPAVSIALAREGYAIGLKDSSGDLAGMRSVVNAVRDLPFSVLTGSETMADIALDLGADGIVPGLGNVDPAGYVRLYSAARAGDRVAAAAEQARLTKLFGIVDVADRTRIGFTAGALGAFKEALAYQGWIDSPSMWPPLGALDDVEKKAVRELVAQASGRGGGLG